MSARTEGALTVLPMVAPPRQASPPPVVVEPAAAVSPAHAAIRDARSAAFRCLRTAERARMWWLGDDEETPLNHQGRMDTPLQ